MCKRFIPYAHAKNIYEVDIDFFKFLGAKYLFLDLDNTLDSYRSMIPNERSVNFIKSLKENGITPIILSNNRGKRVKGYAEKLDIECIHSVGKPFPFRIKRLIKRKGIDPNEIIMVGDQMITDVCSGNGAKIKVILTDKLVKEDQFTTHFNRFFERPYRSYCKKHGKLIDWRIRYGKS